MHLNEAIYLFFGSAHPAVTETLIGAAMGVLRPLGKQYGLKAVLYDSDRIKPEYRKKWIEKHLHKVQNFSKHADRDLMEILSYETEVLHFRIFEACDLYRHISAEKNLNYRQSQSAIMYETWFCLKYPELLKDPVEFDSFLKNIGIPSNFSINDFESLRLVAEHHRIRLCS